MGAEEAVFTAAVARDEVRKSIARMAYHMARGERGVRGVEREKAFLDALGRQAARLGAGATGVPTTGAPLGLGTKAYNALRASLLGNGAAAGRIRSSLLAQFSQDTMAGSREWVRNYQGTWVWVANASACAACLNEHGTRHRVQGFTPMHPSCLCFPETLENANAKGVRQLTQREITQALQASNNPAFADTGEALAAGNITVAEAVAGAVRRSLRGLRLWRQVVNEQGERQSVGGTDLKGTPSTNYPAR